MIAVLNQLRAKIGIDRAVAYALLLRGWQVLAGPITVAVIAVKLGPKQQGFYFTFASILALQVFFEMGLSLVIQQCVSHELPRLVWNDRGIGGDVVALQRFRQLLRKSLLWFSVAGIVFGLIGIVAGLNFFAREPETAFAWRLPWAMLVVATAANMVFIPLSAALEGGGHIVEVNRLRFAQNSLGNIAAWSVLLANGQLYAAPMIAVATLVVNIAWFSQRRRDLVTFALKQTSSTVESNDVEFSWFTEVWPMQWRIAVSWMSGYLISQLFTPVLFHYHGAIEAGRMGMTLTLANGLSSVALIWINVKMWQFGGLVARRDWVMLDALFARTFRQSLVVAVVGAVAIIGVVGLLQPYAVSERFLSVQDVALLMTSVILNHVIAALAQYLRAHKKEPFVWLSVIGGVLVGLSTWFLGWHFGSLGMILGLLAINVGYGLPSAIWLWARLRRDWHRES